MSFDGQKNSSCPPVPPWQRNTQQISSLQTHLGLSNQALVTYAQNQPVYNTNIAMAQQPQASQQQTQNNIPLISQISSQMPSTQIFTQTVSYPTRALNPIAFNQQPISAASHQTQIGTMIQSSSMSKTHVFNGIGVVTKVQNDVGFIDKEVFFNKNACVKGIVPKVGDRVLVEVTYNQNMPFKWNATRVQLTSAAGPGLGLQTQNRNVLPMTRNKSSSGYANVPPPPSLNGTNFSRSLERSRNLSPTPSSRNMEKISSRSRDPRIREMEAKAEEEERKRRRERELREKEKHRERKDSTPDRRERSPPRRSPPKKRRARAIPRYMVQVPKSALTVKEADVLILKRRYNNLYIPSDFFYSNIKWSDAFPPHVPFSINKPCSFHIMRKDVEPVICGELLPEPEDADYLFSAKVMLMGSPPMEEIYKKCITTAEEREDEDRDVVHPSRLINFLVGIRGKNEAMAIGGPWSPSLDGENPQSDVSVLIRTAIRSCKGLTGIDLSNCTQWYRFVELYYRRGEVSQKGRVIPPRIETVVIFLPDVRSCIPTRLEWDALHVKYRRTLDRILRQEDDDEEEETVVAPPPPIIVDKSLPAECVDEQVVVSQVESSADAEQPAEKVPPSELSAETVEQPVSAESVAEETLAEIVLEPVAEEPEQQEVEVSEKNEAAAVEANVIEEEVEEQQETSSAPDDAEKSSTEKDENADEDVEMKKEPTHFSQLDTKTMKIQELRDELEARNFSSKGLKPQLAARLAKILKAEASDEVEEKEAKDQGESEKDTDQVMESAEEKEEIENKETKEVNEKSEEKTEPEENKTELEEEKPETEEQKAEPKEEKTEEPEEEEKEEGEITEEEIKVEMKPEPEKESTDVVPENSGDSSTKEDADVVEILEASDAAFNDGDYSDLMIIDDEENKPAEKPKPKKEKKPLDEREKQALEKKYALPNTPQLIVHPSKLAKNGKFDCTVMSLSLLLDYRPEDTKEHSFEVSLFAELFNEMLMRDFGYNIYRALSMVQEKSKDGTEVKKDSADSLADDFPAKKDEEDSSKSKKSDRDSRSRHHDESDDDTVSVRSGEKRKRDKDRQKAFTAHPDLLLSFVYFDQTHCGYIFEKDIEDLFHTIGLDLSRNQVRKLVGKSISRDSLYYRKLTDSVKEIKEDGTEEVIEDIKKEENLSDDVLRGNKFYLPVFRGSSDTTVEPPLKKMKTEDGEAPAPVTSGLVVLKNGVVVDVEKLLTQMNRSEKALEDTEKMLLDTRKQVADLQASNSKANNKIKDLSSDLKSVTRKLNETEVTLSNTQRKAGEYHAVLSSVQDRVGAVLTRNDKSEKTDKNEKEKGEKSEKSSEEKRSHRSDSRSRDDRKERDRSFSKSVTPKKDD
ncbi:cell division cycle and apoptosis regulator protein 1 [Sergentomyia squamirostris]